MLVIVILASINMTTVLASSQSDSQAGIEFVGHGIIFHSNYRSTTSIQEDYQSVVVSGITLGSSINNMGFEYRVPDFTPPISATFDRSYQFAGWHIVGTPLAANFTVHTLVYDVMHINALWYLAPEEEPGATPTDPPAPPTPTDPAAPTDPPGGESESEPEPPPTQPTEPTIPTQPPTLPDLVPEVTPIIPDDIPETEFDPPESDDTVWLDLENGGVPLGYASPGDVAHFFDIFDGNVPLGGLEGQDDPNYYFDLDDTGIPLGFMPQTGLENNTPLLIAGMFAAIVLAIGTGFVILKMHKKQH